jgi:hypothetical protein
LAEKTMATRLGHVLGWIGTLIAALLLLVFVLNALHDGPILFGIIFLPPSLASWAIGRGLRYIFAGDFSWI